MDRQVRYEDVAGLNSRVSWGAVFAGSVVAIATYLMLMMFFAAVGLSASDANQTDGRSAAWVALAAGAIALIGSLFLGGYVTTTLTAGENRQEALIHGALTWAVVSVLSMWLVGQTAKTAFNAMNSATNTAANVAGAASANNGGQGAEANAREAGVPQNDINRIKDATRMENLGASVDNLRNKASDPANREDARRQAATGAWVTLFATLVSLGAAIWGALAGAGPSFRLFPVAVAERRDVTHTQTTTNVH